jgi:nucleotide-binding universal stress UspA family protein
MKALAHSVPRQTEPPSAACGEFETAIRALPGRAGQGVRPQTVGPVLNLEKILVPTDFSNASVATLNYAIPLCNYFDAEVSLLHVTKFNDMARSLDNTTLHASHEEASENALRRLERISRQMLPAVHRGKPFALPGEPVRQIVETARWLGSSLIVLSTRSQTGIQHMLKPGIAERVVSDAPCPVFTVRQEFLLNGHSSHASAPADWKNILVPVDFTESSRNTLGYAVALASGARSHFTLFHFAAVHALGVDAERGEPHPDHNSLRRQAEAQLVAWAEKDVPKNIAVNIMVQVGVPAGPLVATAAERVRADLIVQGTHHHTWWERLASDQTAERIVRTAPCPVFSIPENVLR